MFWTRKSKKCEKDIKQDISGNVNDIILSVLGTRFILVKIGHGIVVEDLVFDFEICFLKIWDFKENWDLKFDHMI